MKRDQQPEPKVKPLVSSMNSLGVIQTTSSCQGHLIRARSPFVMFYATVEIAGAFDNWLKEFSETESLHANWGITGHFLNTGELIYTLHCPEYDAAVYSLVDSFWLYGIQRRLIDQDLTTLAHEIAHQLGKRINQAANQGTGSVNND